MSSNNLDPEKLLIFDVKGPMAHFGSMPVLM